MKRGGFREREAPDVRAKDRRAGRRRFPEAGGCVSECRGGPASAGRDGAKGKRHASVRQAMEEGGKAPCAERGGEKPRSFLAEEASGGKKGRRKKPVRNRGDAGQHAEKSAIPVGTTDFFIGYGAVRRPGGGHASSEAAGRAIGADLPEACPGGRRKACRTRVCFRLPRDAWREVWSLRLRGVPRRAGVRGLRPVRPWEVSVCPHPDAWPGDVLRRTVPDESWAAWDRLLRASPWAVWDRRVFPERRREVCARRGAVTEDALPEVLFPGVLYLAADDVRG